jgi:hypothetical protein
MVVEHPHACQGTQHPMKRFGMDSGSRGQIVAGPRSIAQKIGDTERRHHIARLRNLVSVDQVPKHNPWR